MSHQKLYEQFLLKNRYPRQLISYENKSLINFSSNDYLGLSKHPLIMRRCQDFTKRFGVGVSSSRLVSGNVVIFDELEQQLAKSLRKPAALIMGTGYQTNFTVLEALLNQKVLGRKPTVFCDRWCHTSIITTVLHFAEVKRFRHNDLDHLHELLELESNASQPKFILAESLYSMDGDQLDLKKVSDLAKKYQAMLYIDDAHSVGVYGLDGWGNTVQHAEDIDVVMGTFSKALGSFGGYIGCSEVVKDYLVNKCRGLIYSTALPIPLLGAISAAIELVPQLNNARQKLMHHTKKMLTFFQENHLNCGTANSHIIPWIIGDSKKTIYASELLKMEGILGVTIRPPSVPLGQSRIRFCLTAAHSEEEIDKLIKAITHVSKMIGKIQNGKTENNT